jgi:hypothetical protein
MHRCCKVSPGPVRTIDLLGGGVDKSFFKNEHIGLPNVLTIGPKTIILI